MLQQILKNMYVDPDILAELGEEQKEMLFLKIRQEQVRRYKKHENEHSSKTYDRRTKKSTTKRVKILEDSTGSPWTWVYGEHEETVKDMWKRQDKEKTPIAEKSVIKKESKHIVKNDTSKDKKTDNKPKISITAKKVNASVLPNQMNGSIAVKKPPDNKSHSSDIPPPEKSQIPPKNVLSQHNKNIMEKLKQGEATKRIAGFERKKTSVDQEDLELPPTSTQQLGSQCDDMVEVKSATENNSSFNAKSEQDCNTVSPEDWSQQLRRFKEADQRRSLRARNASKQWKRQSRLAIDTEKVCNKFRKLETNSNKQSNQMPPTAVGTKIIKHQRSQKHGKPQSLAEIKQWFEETQSNIFFNQDSSGPPTWFHGIISRQDADNILKPKNKGDFLIRVSNKIWGFVLSYKDKDETKHFLIDASEEHCYHFFGDDQIRHGTLNKLVKFHQVETLMYGGEVLRNAIGQLDPTCPNYYELDRSLDTRL